MSLKPFVSCVLSFPRGTSLFIYQDELFADLYPDRGQPVYAPWRLAPVTVFGLHGTFHPSARASDADARRCNDYASASIAPFFAWGPTHEAGSRDELDAYVTLGRITMTYHGMAYEPRGSGAQSLHRTCGSHVPPGRLGKPTTAGRKTGNVEFSHETRYAKCKTPGFT
jgi:hypothetical protein